MKKDVLMEEFKKNRHSIYSLNYHLVVVTKFRNKCISPEIMKELKNILTCKAEISIHLHLNHRFRWSVLLRYLIKCHPTHSFLV